MSNLKMSSTKTSIKSKGKSVKNRKVTSKVMIGSGKKGTKTAKKTNVGLFASIANLPKPLYFGIFLIVFGAIGTKMLFFSGATAFQYVGTHPQAINQPETSWGRQLTSLAAWNGKIYAGYGDWNDNTGPISITPFDPVTNSFASSPELISDTESVEIWREFNGKLYGVSVDPRGTAEYAVAEVPAGSKTPVWANKNAADLVHVFDMAQRGNDLFMAGSQGGSDGTDDSVIYRSTDGGSTWQSSLNVNGGTSYHSRMYFMASYNGKVYAQQLDFDNNYAVKGIATNSWVFDGANWTKGAAINTYIPYKGAEFSGKLILQSSTGGGSLLGFDGRTTTTIRSNIRDYKIHSDGYLYALTYNNNALSVMRTRDLASWEQVSVAPSDSKSIALLGNTLYIGTTESQLYKAEINPLITDTTPPTAAIIAPTAPYTVTTNNTFAVSASDPASIAKVEFYAGSTLIGRTTSKDKSSSGCFTIGTSTNCYDVTATYPGNYVVQWNGSGLAVGTYPLKAIAFDLYGNSRETSSVDIIVPAGLYPPDTQSPTITVTSPSNSQRVRKTVWINASAKDNDQVAYMEAQLDGNTVATNVTGSLSKSVAVSRGSHKVVIIAKDRAGNTTQTEQTFTSR